MTADDFIFIVQKRTDNQRFKQTVCLYAVKQLRLFDSISFEKRVIFKRDQQINFDVLYFSGSNGLTFLVLIAYDNGL